MQRVASNGLLDLRHLQIVVTDNEVADRLALLREGDPMRCRDLSGGPRKLHGGAAEHRLRPNTAGEPDGSLTSNGHGLDRLAVRHNRENRDHSAVRKIDVVDRLPWLLEDPATRKLRFLEMRGKSRKLILRQQAQQAIARPRHEREPAVRSL